MFRPLTHPAVEPAESPGRAVHILKSQLAILRLDELTFENISLFMLQIARTFQQEGSTTTVKQVLSPPPQPAVASPRSPSVAGRIAHKYVNVNSSIVILCVWCACVIWRVSVSVCANLRKH